jgi:uncharacterized protein
MIDKLSYHQISAIFEALPIEITFSDENDIVRYWNKHENRIYQRPLEALGKDVRDCHSNKSIKAVDELLNDFKNGKKDILEYNSNSNGKLVNVKYIAVRDENMKFLGVVEALQDITGIMNVKIKE